MKMESTKDAKKLRKNTDLSLVDERIKADEFLVRKSEQIEKDTSETIRKSRDNADKIREEKRDAMDLDKGDDPSVIRDRKNSDNVQVAERIKEDTALEKERFEKRLIAEDMLLNVRKETDNSLYKERIVLDSEVEQHSELLSKEKVSHESTKSALEVRDQFLAIVSHDLKNPIAAISIGASLMRRILSKEKPDKEMLFKNLSIIEQSTASMDRMISDLLDVERMASGKLTINKKMVDLCALLEECKEIFSPSLLSKSFSMVLQTCPTPQYALIDHDRMVQVLSNLIGNAIKFTQKGGVITLSAQKKENIIELSVSDNGPGITLDKQTQIFTKFSQLKSNDRNGLGLGLFIAKWIVDAHNGSINVESEVGKGSKFTVSLSLDTSDS